MEASTQQPVALGSGRGDAAISLTVGAGLDRPAGKRVTTPVKGNVTRALADTIDALEPAVEGWWTPALFRGDYRAGDRWEGATACGIDIDYLEVAGELHVSRSRLAGWLAGYSPMPDDAVLHSLKLISSRLWPESHVGDDESSSLGDSKGRSR